MLNATILSNEVVVVSPDEVVRAYCVTRDTDQKKVVNPFDDQANAFGTEEVCKSVSKVSKEAPCCGTTKGVAGVEGKEVRLVGDAYHYTRPLVPVEGDDLIGFCNITNSSLGSGGKAKDQSEDSVKGAPGAWEIVGSER